MSNTGYVSFSPSKSETSQHINYYYALINDTQSKVNINKPNRAANFKILNIASQTKLKHYFFRAFSSRA